ncbi:MAG TPA: hypothetical protein VIC08_08165 [Cellvibrionaceae bacterium]
MKSLHKVTLLSSLIISSSFLAGCGSEPDSNAPDIIINIENPDGNGGGGPELPEIANTALPIIEDFSASDTAGFFSSAYKALASDTEDGEDAFYYPMAGAFADDGSVDPEGGIWITADNDQALRIGNSRLTVAQTVSPLAGEVEDPRKDSTPGDGIDEGLSWGELDLSEPYKISFCVVAATSGPSSSLFQIYADNNTVSEASSIHGGGNSGSRIFNQPVNTLVAGQRVEINIPGDTTLQPGGELVASKPDPVGTANTFLNLRVSSGGWVVVDDLVIEYQTDAGNNPQPDCAAKTTDYTMVHPITGGSDSTAPEVPHEGTPFTGLPLSLNFSADADTFFGENEEADFLAISDNAEAPFYLVTSGGSRISIADNALSMNNARFTIGDTGIPSADGVAPSGDIDLSEPYRISITITDFTNSDDADPGAFQVYVDNNTTSSGNSIHGGDSRVSQISPADIPELPYTLVLEPEIGTANSFLQIRADSRVGNLTISDITIEELGGTPIPTGIWGGQALTLAGSADIEPAGEVTLDTETEVAMNFTGGNMSSSNHVLYFASQFVDMGEFSFTARIKSVTGADIGAGNAYRFGLMMMENMTPVGATYANLAAWADAGFYVNKDDLTLVGSRAHMKPDGSRSRSDINELEVGDYVRIEIFNDGENKRVKRYYSKDGVTFEQANSTTDFSATPESNSWYVGFYGAPGENNISIEFDNIAIEPFVAE